MPILFDELKWRYVGTFNSELSTGSGTSNQFWLRIDGEGWCKAFVSKSISDPEAYSIMYWGKNAIWAHSRDMGWQWLREKSPRHTEHIANIRHFDMFELALLLSTAEWEPPQE